MKRYEVFIYIANGSVAKLRFDTDDLDEACDMKYEIEKTSKEEFEGTAIYDNKEHRWFGWHQKGTAYVLG